MSACPDCHDTGYVRIRGRWVRCARCNPRPTRARIELARGLSQTGARYPNRDALRRQP